MSPITDESCGIVKATLNVDNFFSLPTRPGQFPWTVAIYRYLHDEQESIYKCGGTIIDKFTILTSVNCLLEDGLMLKHSDLQVYVSPYSLSARQKDLNIYNIAELNAHELYNYHLENNIAALKLAREIEFSDYVQPICLPDANLVVNRKIGKVCIVNTFGFSYTICKMFDCSSLASASLRRVFHRNLIFSPKLNIT